MCGHHGPRDHELWPFYLKMVGCGVLVKGFQCNKFKFHIMRALHLNHETAQQVNLKLENGGFTSGESGWGNKLYSMIWFRSVIIKTVRKENVEVMITLLTLIFDHLI